MASADKKNVAKKKEKASPRQREGPDTSTFGECDASDKSKLSQSPGIIKEVKCDMAERRMFSQKIVQSSKFLQMPKSSQCLYFHLGLRADDDGVVEAYSVMNMIKANEDDLKLLVAKGYVVILNEYLVAYTGVKRIRIHDLRHSHVAHLIELGFSPVEIAERLGHEGIAVTLHYSHLYPSKQVELADRLNRDHNSLPGDDNDESMPSEKKEDGNEDE